MALLRDGVGVEVCPLVMVKVMKAFVCIVVDQDEQVLHSTVRVRAKRSSASCVRQSVPHSNITHAVLLSEEVSCSLLVFS